MSRAYREEECRKELIQHFETIVDYWENESRAITSKEKLDGLLHSILCVFDGVSGFMPSYNISLNPHPDDKAYYIHKGENYYEPDMIINEDIPLHEILNR